jgi:hypothetical protein
MLMSNDLRCADCDYTEIDAIYERNDGPPVCPDCGTERTPDWSTGRAPAISGHGPGSFARRDMGVFGVCETKEDYTRVENMIKTRFPGHSVQVENDSASDKRNRSNDARHRLWSQRKKVGLDAHQVSEMNAEKKRTKGIKNAKVLNNKPAPAMK